MRRNPFGIETKTAASTAIGGLVTLVLLLNTWRRWFTPPPAGTVAAIEAAMVGLVGYFAKHTPRTGVITGNAQQPTVIRLPSNLTDAQAAAFKADIEDALKAAAQPATQPAPEGTAP